jgi:putative ABC transport system permease protein
MRADVAGFLREAGRGLTRGGYALRSGLVVVQIALALTLLIGAGLLMHSFVRLLDTSPGFNATNLVTLSTQLAQSDLAPERRRAVYTAVREKLMALPGVQNVGAVSRLPMLGQNLGSSMWIEGRNQTSAESTSVEYRVATPSYFPTMGIKLISGRFFDDHDESAAGSMVLINETAAKKFFAGEDPVGKRIKLGANPATLPWMNIIGVIGDIRHFGLDLEARPEAYRPYAATPLLAPNLVIRSASDPKSMISSMAAAVRSVNASMPVYNLFRMEELVARSTAQRRFTMALLIGFAAAALLLAAVGIYGAVSQSVAQRTQEIGIRMALGAEPISALRMVLIEALKLAGIGAVIGLIAAFPISRAMKSLLYEISPLDPAVFVLAAITLGALAVAASIPPARRATKVDPVVALRHE